jgi:hypothetical protein
VYGEQLYEFWDAQNAGDCIHSAHPPGLEQYGNQ